MLNHLLSLCLLTLLSAGQNCIPRMTDLGEGSLGAESDYVIHLNFSSGETFNPIYDKQEDVVSYLYNAGGNFTHVRCHDLVCEDRTGTVIDAGACQGTACAASFCRKHFFSDTPKESFVYHSPATHKVYAVGCHDTVCDDAVSEDVWSGSTSSLGCALDVERNVFFTVPSYSASNAIFRCGETCSSVESFLEGSLVLQASRVAVDMVFYGSTVHTVLVFLHTDSKELYVAQSYDFGGFRCRCTYPSLLAQNVVDVPFAARMELYSTSFIQVSYMGSENGVTSLYLVSCRIGYRTGCSELHKNVIDTLPFGDPPMPSISYDSQLRPVIAYRHRDAQGVWYVKVARCLDDPCSQADVSSLPQDDVVHAVSVAVNEDNDDLYVLYSVGASTSRIKLHTCLNGIDTPYPSRSPSQKPTLTPSAPTPSFLRQIPAYRLCFLRVTPTMVNRYPYVYPYGCTYQESYALPLSNG